MNLETLIEQRRLIWVIGFDDAPFVRGDRAPVNIEHAVTRLPDPLQRLEAMGRAGEIHRSPPFYFQVCGTSPNLAAIALERLTDRGHVPEALRTAHLITSAVIKGESGNQA
ncbi:MAG: DUF99 family protein [Oscillatoriales cyanobacterium C42_A2020_001]|nr:DUF99 family protein [Leptolyngbyaceae cyanobacterium C42_A2020_001]